MAIGILIAQTCKIGLPDGCLEGLGSLGCLVRTAAWGPDLFAVLDGWSPDIVMLQHDGGDGGPDGYLDALRQHPTVAHAVLGLVTATAAPQMAGDGKCDLLLHAGEFADYLRVFARLRQQLAERGSLLTVDPVVCGEAFLDAAERTVRIDGHDIKLSARESALLEYLARRPGRIFSRRQLLSAIWSDARNPDRRTVDVVVMRVRKALARVGAQDMIRTVHKRGYQLRPPLARVRGAARTEPVGGGYRRASPWSLGEALNV